MASESYGIDRQSAERMGQVVREVERVPRPLVDNTWPRRPGGGGGGAGGPLIRGVVRSNPFLYGIPPGEWGMVDRGEGESAEEFYTYNAYVRAWCPPGVIARIEWVAEESRYELVGWECGQSQCPELETP